MRRRPANGPSNGSRSWRRHDPPTIYISPGSHHSRRVTLLIHELGLDVELIKVDVRPPGMGGENSQPPFLAINPNGKVPVLREGDFELWESNAIMWYLAEGHGDTPLWPADRCARAQIAKWQVWQAAHLSAAADALMYEALVRPMLKQPPDQDKLAAATASFHRWAKVLDGALTATEYLTGGCMTCADLAMASALMYAPLANMPIGEHPPVRQWFERMCARPSWQATAPSALINLTTYNVYRKSIQNLRRRDGWSSGRSWPPRRSGRRA